MRQISSDELLPVGTHVQVKNKRGVVVAAKMERAVPSGYVAVHVIKFNCLYVFRSGNQSPRVVPLEKTETLKVNYSFIFAL